ncbi:peptide-methionine (S)-S-oxide reductase MsrA [Urbifossiella limnaea]|uniref:Peptide methionine sulfoxide reductase MsrA n=1 Tax=Urbifossiella limnaea TaxID=2528023 RepID=A0A517XYD4_9BACT|nr:peptide-methionine (S)-S-oxide reductase MsrA [Urbifossiella limnaea]QDU22501.1 Peptide methionine sulfoxide reductase MsrA [Urbifossiella limnaea]
MWVRLLPLALVAAGVAVAVFTLTHRDAPMPTDLPTLTADELGPTTAAAGDEVATFGTGCFWCTEAVFQQIRGVKRVVSGYTGGQRPNPTYEQICTGTTGHAEAVQVTFDPAVVSYPELLEVFWRSHDPTTLNRQGADVGTQYRSAIFYHTDRQRELADRYKRKVDEAGVFASPIVTEITPAATFYPAEAYHQNFFNDNPRQPYCRAVVGPKVEKLRQVFKGRLLAE